MVIANETQYRYKVADELELDIVLSGKHVGGGAHLSGAPNLSRLELPGPGLTGVLWRDDFLSEGLACPLLLVTRKDDVRRLCGRYAQLRSDLSPLSAWCHLISPAQLESLEGLARSPHLEGLEAAWIGLVVAETLLLVDKPISSVRISACLATQTFAIARTNALWRDFSVDDILEKFESANRLFRSDSNNQKGRSVSDKTRASFQPIWSALLGCLYPSDSARNVQSSLSNALQALHRARVSRDANEAARLAEPLLHLVPAAGEFRGLADLAPEQRLHLFDKLVGTLQGASQQERNATALLAGYLSTVAAGGAPSLSLAEGFATQWPEILAWAYTIGGIGERIVWTSAFDGLGRLVARELIRPFRLDEAPSCDISFDEAVVLVDSQLSDPFVHLRIKQARLVNVEVIPGVNIAIPISDGATQVSAGPRPDSNRSTRVSEPAIRESMSALADTLWPYLRARLDEYFQLNRSIPRESPVESQSARKGRGKKSGAQSQLPLGTIGKKS
jgi:hypothetical protein